ncbi:hypothetical protein ACHAXN_003722 [Cyclotella atomus]
MSTDTNSEVPEGHQLITEGPIQMMYPQTENSVFYNPVQVQNRDLSILMISMYAQRNIERKWETAKKKEVRRQLVEERGDPKEEGSKEERRKKNDEFDREIEERVKKEKEGVDFVKLTKKSGFNSADGAPNGETSGSGGLTILEALAASGLRSLRYWKEIPGVRTIVMNDLDPVAIELARENVIRNGMERSLAKKSHESAGSNANEKDEQKQRPPGITLQVGDATHELYMSRLPPSLPPSQQNPSQLQQKPQYDVIDLDPYGSASPFLDGAVQAVKSGGLLAVTCTDMAALGGSHPETCYGRYAAFPIQRSGYLQELALRMLLYQISVVAGRYGRSIRPVLSVGMAFYCRVFVEVYDDKAGVNNLSLMHGHLFQSTQCSSFHVTPIGTNELVSHQLNPEKYPNPGGKKLSNVFRNGRGPCDLEPVCDETGASYKIGGPLWIGPLHDLDVVNNAITKLETAQENKGVGPSDDLPIFPLHTATTLHGLLVSVSEELPDVPLYYTLTNLCSAVNSCTIPMQSFRAALINAGYRVSAYHKEPQAVKTDAPNHVVWDVVRAWCKNHPPNKRKESKRHQKGEEQGSNAPPNQLPLETAEKILSKKMKTVVDFTIPRGLGERKKARRFAVNPEANWGPKKAASGKNKRKLEDVESK